MRTPLTKLSAVLTLSACTPPLDQVLCLWDFLLAFGPHMNVLCVIAQVLLMRDDLLATSSPMKLLRMFPPLDAQPIISIAVTLVRDIPEDVSRMGCEDATNTCTGLRRSRQTLFRSTTRLLEGCLTLDVYHALSRKHVNYFNRSNSIIYAFNVV